MSDPRPPLSTTTSLKPAASVLAIAVAVLTIFLGINLIEAKPNPTTTTLPIIVGGLPATTGPSAMSTVCAHGGVIPSDVDSALVSPEGSLTSVAPRIRNAGAGDFDCEGTFVTPASPGRILGFYQAQLSVRGWRLFSRGSSTGQPQFLFQRASSDGFYWVIGVTVTHSHGSSSTWMFRVYQNSESV